jgi:hypothetical protein
MFNGALERNLTDWPPENVRTACSMNMALIWRSLLLKPEQMLRAFIQPNGLQEDSNTWLC